MLNNLGVAHERSGENGDALRAWRRALDLQPHHAQAQLNMDRVQVLVDEEVADELARILAGRDAEVIDTPATAATGVPTDSDNATP